MPDDNRLWKAAGSDDYVAFDRIVERYYEALVAFSTSITHEREKSKDIVQDIFINLWTDRNKRREFSSLKDYLYTATRNRSLNHLRSLKRQREFAARLAPEEYNGWKEIVENEVMRLLSQAIESLPLRNREVIMNTLDGVKQEKIAEVMNVSVRTVKAIKAESIRALRTFLDDDGQQECFGGDKPGNMHAVLPMLCIWLCSV